MRWVIKVGRERWREDEKETGGGTVREVKSEGS